MISPDISRNLYGSQLTQEGGLLRVEDDLAEQHVFECCDRPRAVDGVVALEGLKVVGVGRLPVLLLRCVDDPCNTTHTSRVTSRSDGTRPPTEDHPLMKGR